MNNETYRSGNRYHYKSIFMDVNNRVMMGRELKMLGQFALKTRNVVQTT